MSDSIGKALPSSKSSGSLTTEVQQIGAFEGRKIVKLLVAHLAGTAKKSDDVGKKNRSEGK